VLHACSRRFGEKIGWRFPKNRFGFEQAQGILSPLRLPVRHVRMFDFYSFFRPGTQALARSLRANCVHRSGKAESGRSVIAWAAMIYAKGPGDIDPSPTTAGQSRLSGHGLDSSSAIGNSTTNPMPNLNAPMVKGSLWPAKSRADRRSSDGARQHRRQNAQSLLHEFSPRARRRKRA
jgi:hypothetical protein